MEKPANKNVDENKLTPISKRYETLEVTSTKKMKSEEGEDGRELLEESHSGDFRSFSDARFFNSGPRVEGLESQHFIPSYVEIPTFFRLEHHASTNSTVAPSNNELFSCTTYDTVSTAAPAPIEQRRLRVGDHVELHSFPNATWMRGLKARVKYVMRGDKRRKNRAGRVTIEYDELEFRENPLYRNTVPLTNVRLIARGEGMMERASPNAGSESRR